MIITQLNVEEYSLKDILDITKGKAPCSVCTIQNTCNMSVRCKKYQEWNHQKRRRTK